MTPAELKQRAADQRRGGHLRVPERIRNAPRPSVVVISGSGATYYRPDRQSIKADRAARRAARRAGAR